MKEIIKSLRVSLVVLVGKLASVKFVIWIMLTIVATVELIVANVSFNDWSKFELGITALLYAANQTQKAILRGRASDGRLPAGGLDVTDNKTSYSDTEWLDRNELR